jgi:hypothetical protein
LPIVVGIVLLALAVDLAALLGFPEPHAELLTPADSSPPGARSSSIAIVDRRFAATMGTMVAGPPPGEAHAHPVP